MVQDKCPEHGAITCPDCGKLQSEIAQLKQIIAELKLADSTWRLQSQRKPQS